MGAVPRDRAVIGLLAQRAALLGLSPEWLIERDAPGGLAPPGIVSANGHCRLLACADGWVALNLARADDRDLVPALAGREGPAWDVLGEAAAQSPAADFRDRASELQLPVAIPGEASPLPLAAPERLVPPRRVLDLSALWAGPLCAGLLARAGSDVVRIESAGRPDPTPMSSPRLDARINAGKTRLALDLRTPDGRAALLREIERADAVVTSARAAALARLGIHPDQHPGKAWIAITAHGWASGRVGFGDDCAVAGGLVQWQAGDPRFLGDALADPLTGLEAALAALSGRTGLIDMAMARVAASYAGAA